MDEINLQILNCVWVSMKGATWFSENSEFTLDYVCVYDSALKCVESAYILKIWEVVESDHATVGVNVEWKVGRQGKCRMKGKSKRKKADCKELGVLGAKWKKEIMKIYLV